VKLSIKHLTVLALIFWTISGTVYSESPAPIKIGAVLDLSSDYAEQCTAMREGIELAQDEINKDSTNRRPLQIIFEDSHYNMTQVRSAAMKLINIDKVEAAVISTFTEVMVAGPIFERAKIPLINLWDSAPEIEQIGDYVFGIGVWTPSSTDAASNFAFNNLKVKTAVTFATNGEWSLSTASDFAKKFEAGGEKILGQYALNPSDTDFRTILLKAKVLKPDIIYAPVADNIPTFFKQLKAAKIDADVITSDVITEQMLGDQAAVFENIYQTQTANPSSDRTKHMLERYKEKFGHDCKQTLFTAWGYDSIYLLANAMKNETVSGAATKENLYKVNNYSGASGNITIDSLGSSKISSSVFQAHSGKMIPAL